MIVGLQPEVLEDAEIRDLLRNRDNEENRNIIIKSMVKMIYSIAESKHNPYIDFEDLEHEGIRGLMKAIDKFDHDLHTKFSSFAYYYIYGFIQNAVKKSAHKYPCVNETDMSEENLDDGDNEDGGFIENIVNNEYHNSCYSNCENMMNVNDMDSLLEKLTDCEALCVVYYYGLWGEKPLTYKEIGEIMKKKGHSPAGVKYIIDKGMEKMKSAVCTE